MWATENLVTSLKKTWSHFLTWVLCIISCLAVWTAKMCNIINNGLLGLSLTTTVRSSLTWLQGCCEHNQVVASTEITLEASLNPAIHYTIAMWAPIVLGIFSSLRTQISAVLNLHIYSRLSSSQALLWSSSLFLGFTQPSSLRTTVLLSIFSLLTNLFSQ